MAAGTRLGFMTARRDGADVWGSARMHGQPIDHASLWPIYEHIQMLGMPFFIHLINLVGHPHPRLPARLIVGFREHVGADMPIAASPEPCLERFWLDSVSYCDPALLLGIACVGVEHIVMGSDAPFAIGALRARWSRSAASPHSPRATAPASSAPTRKHS